MLISCIYRICKRESRVDIGDLTHQFLLAFCQETENIRCTARLFYGNVGLFQFERFGNDPSSKQSLL